MYRAVTTFNQSVDRRLVHRSSVASVFLTSVRQCADNEWVFGVQVPRVWDSSSRSRASSVPLTYGTEVLRQSGLAVTHTGFAVPLDYAFTIQEISFAWTSTAPSYPLFGPYEAAARMVVVDHVVRRGETSGLRLEFSLLEGDHAVAHGGGLLRCLPRDQYDLLRRRTSGGPPVVRHDRRPVRRVSRHRERLSGLMGWNHADPFAFDHATDHLPGMALMHSAIHAAELASSASVRALSVRFERFTEFAPTPTLSAVASSGGEVQVEVTQAGTITTRGTFHVR